MNKGNFTDFLALVFMKLWEDQKIHHKILFIILTHFLQNSIGIELNRNIFKVI